MNEFDHERLEVVAMLVRMIWNRRATEGKRKGKGRGKVRIRLDLLALTA
jgi:hypothetical protein